MRAPGLWWGALTAALLISAWGCGKKLVTTAGTVTLDGQPLEGAEVQFHPETPGGEYAHGRSGSDGAFRLRTDKDGGVVPGTYRATVVKFGPSKKAKGKQSILPSIYSSKDTTPFRFTIPHDGPIALDLSGEGRR
jgi:hypothetical protein